jgi:hypothetical protein
MAVSSQEQPPRESIADRFALYLLGFRPTSGGSVLPQPPSWLDFAHASGAAQIRYQEVRHGMARGPWFLMQSS